MTLLGPLCAIIKDFMTCNEALHTKTSTIQKGNQVLILLFILGNVSVSRCQDQGITGIEIVILSLQCNPLIYIV